MSLLYRTRWAVELLFKKLKSRFGLDEIKTTDPYLIEALILIAAISLMMSRVIDELQKLDAAEQESADDAAASSTRVPRGRGASTIIELHSHLIHLYVMLDFGLRSARFGRVVAVGVT